MGLLIDGKWHDNWYDTKTTEGEFIRKDAQFRDVISTNKANSKYQPEVGRYHLFVSLACPWAHRVLILRKIKRLEEVISVTIVKPKMLENGWEIDTSTPLGDIQFLHQVYTASQADYTGRVTVPVLWDKKTNSIVNNESSEIIRMLDREFNDYTENKSTYYPEHLKTEIDEINRLVYENINNGVYKVGFATTQKAYNKAFKALFDTLDALEQRLSSQRYLINDIITEADWRLFTTLIRFDAVYFGHFKTNLKQINDYPNLSNYVRDLYQQKGIADTVNFEHIKTHYYYSHDMINPTRIIPIGPKLNFGKLHDRNRFTTAIKQNLKENR